MNAAALKSEVQTDPLNLGYAQFLPDNPGKVVELLNANTQQLLRSRMVTARAILAECQGGAQILDKLESAATAVTEVKWAVRFLQQEAGIDVGHPATQSMIGQLVERQILTDAEGAALKAMALRPGSRAEVLALGRVTETDLIEAGVI